MGGVGSGSAVRKPITLTCKHPDCNKKFIAKRKDAKFCSLKCKYSASARQKMIDSHELIKCRICKKAVKTTELFTHFYYVHNITIAEARQ